MSHHVHFTKRLPVLFMLCLFSLSLLCFVYLWTFISSHRRRKKTNTTSNTNIQIHQWWFVSIQNSLCLSTCLYLYSGYLFNQQQNTRVFSTSKQNSRVEVQNYYNFNRLYPFIPHFTSRHLSVYFCVKYK